MNTLAAVQARLVTTGVATAVGGLTGWPCFRGIMPASPVQAIAVQYTGGFPQSEHSGVNVQGTFQVAVRAADFDTAEAKWIAMFNALQDSQRTADMTDFSLVDALSSTPIQLYDEANRPVMTCNFRFIRTRP